MLSAPQAQLRVSQQMAEEETAEWRQQKELIVRPQLAVVAFAGIDFGQASFVVDARCCVLGFAQLSCHFSPLPAVAAEVGGQGSDGF